MLRFFNVILTRLHVIRQRAHTHRERERLTYKSRVALYRDEIGLGSSKCINDLFWPVCQKPELLRQDHSSDNFSVSLLLLREQTRVRLVTADGTRSETTAVIKTLSTSPTSALKFLFHDALETFFDLHETSSFFAPGANHKRLTWHRCDVKSCHRTSWTLRYRFTTTRQGVRDSRQFFVFHNHNAPNGDRGRICVICRRKFPSRRQDSRLWSPFVIRFARSQRNSDL